MDITERREAEERQALLAREVDHRAKNAMAIVQSIVRLTKAGSISSYVSIIEGRIKALSRAHALLSSSRWQGADLDKLADDELAPYRSTQVDRISISGPKVTLEPTKAQTLALALHELATNAVKYGALSSASGKLALWWDVQPDVLTIHWHETAGPETHPPSVTGFGTQIITGSIERQLGGKTKFEWLPSGLRCTFTIPRGERRAHDEKAEAPAAARTAPLRARRVMIVEDEALVALVLADQLADMGLSVVGPCSSVAEAKAVADKGDFEAAILDVNLGRRTRLSRRGFALVARNTVCVRDGLWAGEHRPKVCQYARPRKAGRAGIARGHVRRKSRAPASGGAHRIADPSRGRPAPQAAPENRVNGRPATQRALNVSPYAGKRI